MTLENLPRLEYRQVPLPERGPAILATLVIDEPVETPIVVALDLSDSCQDLSRQISFVQKLLSGFPGSWPFELIRLSSSATIGRANLRVMDFVESENLIKELCDQTDILRKAKSGGSFLRPVVETLHEMIESRDRGTRLLALVLTDGRFTDFGAIDLHPQLTIVAIMSGSGCGRELIPSLAMHDPDLDAVVQPFRNPFYGSVSLNPVSSKTEDSVQSENLFRIDEHGRLTPWVETEKHFFHLENRPTPFLIDAPVDAFLRMRWQVQSATTAASVIIEGGVPGAASHRSLEKSIASHFAKSDGQMKHQVLFQFDNRSSEWDSIAADAQEAIKLANESKPWIDDNGNSIVFKNDRQQVVCDEFGRPNCDAMILVRTTVEHSSHASNLIAFGLDRNRSVAFECCAEQVLCGLTGIRDIRIRFDTQAYRWFLDDGSPKPIELEYYAAEVMSSMFYKPDHHVEVCFSGNLR